MEPQGTPWKRVGRFVALAAAAGYVIFALGPRFHPERAPLQSESERHALGDFQLPRSGGGDWRLSNHKGDVILLNFWATWCPPCRIETPELVSLHQRYQAQGFQVVGISLDENRAAVPGFISRYGIPYPVLFPTDGFRLASQIESLPTSVLLDRRGRVATVYRGAVSQDDLSADVEALLHEPRPAQ